MTDSIWGDINPAYIGYKYWLVENEDDRPVMEQERKKEGMQVSGKIDVFGDDKSFVRLVDWCGDELAIVNAARVSFHNESKYEIGEDLFEALPGKKPKLTPGVTKDLSQKDKGLIGFLLREKHGSPFEQGFMAQFHIRLPIFVMREWVRHRVGFSINEESGRYVEMRPDFYIPDNIRTQTGKPGAYKFEPVDSKTKNWFQSRVEKNSRATYTEYQYAIGAGVAKEQARIMLPLNLYTEIRWTCNARSLMNFLSLRNNEQAMWEIRQYAKVLEQIFSEHMPNVYASFIKNERIAP